MNQLFLAALALTFAVSSSHAQLERLAFWDGDLPGEQFGIALALGGDANGDGWADLAVGSSASNEYGQVSGKVSIFFGRPVPRTEPDLVLYGEPGSYFGAAVAWVGDVNNDGKDDLLVGAFRDGEGGTDAGKALLFYGGNPMNAAPDLVLIGPEVGGWFGRAVCGIGDLDGDGFEDFAVGAPRTEKGTVYVYFGGNPPAGVAGRVLQGAAVGDRFGSALAGPGNIDMHPGSDLLVGAPRYSVGALWRGAVFLYSGGAEMDSLADMVFVGEGAGDHFGTSVAAAGDVNGDGFPDFIAGAPYYNNNTVVDAGAAYVYWGGSLLDTTADFVLKGAVQEDNLGRSVAGCGDVTGSGYSHFVVGVPGRDLGGVDTGQVLLSPGGNPPHPSALIQINGEAAGDQYGLAVAEVMPFAGSFTGTDSPDFAVGAWSHGTGGRAYLYGVRGTSSLLSDRSSTLVAGGTVPILAWPNPASKPVLDAVGAEIRAAGVMSGAHVTDAGAPGAVALRIRILDARGRLVRTLPADALGSGGRIYWDGRDAGSLRVMSGCYFLVLEDARGSIGSGRLTVVR